jgi:hypothetical protein
MIVPRQSIFRDKALKHYTLGRKKDILPNFSSIPVAIFLWVLLGMIIATGLMAQYTQIPVYLPGAGIVLGTVGQAHAGNDETAVAFIPSGTSMPLHAGLSVQIQTGESNLQFTRTITKIEPGSISLAKAFAEYKLSNSNASLANQSAVLIFIGSGSAVLPSVGSALTLNVLMGTQSLISALLG